MKKIIALLLAVMMLLTLAACGDKEEPVEEPVVEAPVEEIEEAPVVEEEAIATPEPTELPEIDKLTDAALEENEFTVLCSCSEEMFTAAAAEFQAIYGIPVTYKCMSVAEAAAAVEAGSTGADVWMGAPAAVLDKAAEAGLLSPYQAENTGNLLSDAFKSADGSWYGIYADVLGFTFKAGADSVPSGWDALNADTMRISLLDGSGAAAVESGECAVAAGGLSFGVARALAGGSLDFAVPKGELKCLLSGAGIINGCAHADAAKLWMEFMLSSDFATPSGLAGMGLFPVVANSDMPAVAAALELDITKAKAVALDGSEDLAALAEKLK